MNTPQSRYVLLGFAILALSSWALADAETDYKTLFGTDEAKVAASRNAKDAAAFAAKLLNAAKTLGEQKDFQALLCEKAYEFASKDPTGQQTAADALKLLMEAAPEKKAQVQERLVKALQSRFARSTGDDRKRLGEELVELLVSQGDQRAEAKEPGEAVTLYRQALSVATGIGADQAKEVMDKIREITSALDAEKKLAGLKARLTADPKNTAVRTSLILAYLGEMDNPAEAAKLVSPDLDEKLRTYVPLVVKPMADLDESACLELAHWYAELADKASPAAQGVLLGRAKAFCERFLTLHSAMDTTRLKGTMLLEKVSKNSVNTDPREPKVVALGLGKGVTMKLALLPSGRFLMGSADNETGHQPNEGPQHEVRIRRPFFIGVHEVTQVQFEAVMGTNPARFKGPTNPVENVSWDTAIDFCKKLSQKTKKSVRLPTEAEWEYAYRAGTKTSYPFGDDEGSLNDHAWHNGNSGMTTHPVGEKKPNAFGLYDMGGNVCEWCADWYADTYPRAPQVDPQGPKTGDKRVLRGGNWFYQSAFRSAWRIGSVPMHCNDGVFGFRVVVDAK